MPEKPDREIVSVRMSLSRDGDGVVSSLYDLDEEFHDTAPLPVDTVDRYLHDRTGEALGVPMPPAVHTGMVERLAEAVPAGGREWLSRRLPPGGLLALGIEINDRSLERYPWELLGAPNAVVPEGADLIVWRRVDAAPRGREASAAVLAAGTSAPIRAQTHAITEIEAIEDHAARRRIRSHASADAPFGRFREDLERIRPAVVHLITHGDRDHVAFDSPNLLQALLRGDVTCHPIHHQELAARLKASASTVVCVLSICDSASVPRPEAPFARDVAESGVGVVGMATKLRSTVGIVFSAAFYGDLMSGGSLVRAYHAGVQAVRRHPQMKTSFWSVPVLYSQQPDNVIVFPAGDRARARRELRLLQDIAAELAAAQPQVGRPWEESAGTIARLEIRIAYVSETLEALRDPELMSAESLSFRLDFGARRREMETALTMVRRHLESLGRRSGDPARAVMELKRWKRDLDRSLTGMERLLEAV